MQNGGSAGGSIRGALRAALAFSTTTLAATALAITAHAATPLPSTTIYVSNLSSISAYPAARGDIAPLAPATDMIFPSGIARDSGGKIYVTNSDTNTITVYAAANNGNVPPLAVIGGGNTLLANPAGIALDGTGRIYVLNGAGPSITVYPALGAATGILNEAPLAAIGGANAQLNDPVAIAVDPTGTIYVANNLAMGNNAGAIEIYAAGGSGNLSPSRIISGTHTQIAFLVGLAVDSDGNIYAANSTGVGPTGRGGSIVVFAAGSSGDSAPVATIEGNGTALDNLTAIALDAARNIYTIGSTGQFSVINAYASGSNGNVAPSASIAGAMTGLRGPSGLTLDPDGNLYVSNLRGGPGDHGSVTVYPPGSSGNTAPGITLTSSISGLNEGNDIAADSNGNVFVADVVGGPGQSGSIGIYPPGSDVTGPPPATIAGASTGLANPFKIALDAAGDLAALNGNNSITVYPPGSAGDVTPAVTLDIGSHTNTSWGGIAIGPHRSFYVASSGSEVCGKRRCHQTGVGHIAIFSAQGAASRGHKAGGVVEIGAVKAIATIGGPASGIDWPTDIAVDRKGEVFVANSGPYSCSSACGCFPSGKGSVTAYAPGSTGNSTPQIRIAGAKTQLGAPSAIALDSNGNIYVLNAPSIAFNTPTACVVQTSPGIFFVGGLFFFQPDSILIFAAGSNGNSAPIGSISGPFSDLYAPTGIAVAPSGP